MTEPDSERATPAEGATKPEAEAEAGAEAKAEDKAEDKADEVEPAKPKKKKKKRAAHTETTEAAPRERPALDEAGRERPAFLREFPEDPDLEPLIQAFERGNYAKVRADAPRVAERTAEPEVKAAAEELLRRIEPDPLVKFLLGVAVALFCAVVGYVYLSH